MAQRARVNRVRTPTSLNPQGIDSDEFCKEAPEMGPCRASLTRWAWSSSTKGCSPFLYGGCEGNQNNFETMEACLAAAADFC